MEGRRIGEYRVERELGSGGMGRVYLARREGRDPVALKVLHPHLFESPGFLERFLREAEIGRSVSHPNVVRTFEAGAAPLDGTTLHFLVMEYVEGQTLRALLEEMGTLPEELCRHLGREVASGLAAIHDAGAVHRDLKPENVLVTPDHRVKIMDLGVARLVDEGARLSRTGDFVGSLPYAAPEQFADGGSVVDGRADLHALGIVLYELASGENPCRGADAKETLRRILVGKPRPLGRVVPQVSPFYEEVVHRLLSREPGDRFPTAGDLLETLARGEASPWWKTRALEIRGGTKRPLRRMRVARETGLYGRERELAALLAAWAAAKAGDGRVAIIEGEAGIGKSRLVDEMVGHLEEDGEDLDFVFGAYPPGGAATASGAWSTAYREHLGDEGLTETLRDLLPEAPGTAPAFAAFLRGEPPPGGREPLTRDSLHTAFVHATRALSRRRPTVVLIEDLQFAPAEGLALFTSLALAVPGHRILLVGTARPGRPAGWRAEIERLEHATRIELPRLGPADLGRLLVEAFRSESLAEELAQRIGTQSDGNPFFVFEIIRGLREGRSITRNPDGTWAAAKEIRDIEIPSSVLEVIEARIAGVSEEEQELLDVAACAGFAFDPTLVAEVAGAPLIPVLRRLGRLERALRIVRSAGRRYVFDHHQVQEALYRRLAAPLREQYHAAIAAALEARAGGDGDGARDVEIFDHFLRGGRMERAAAHLAPAIRHLEGSCRLGDALDVADRALDAPELLAGRARVETLLKKVHLRNNLGDTVGVPAVLAEALPLADAAGDVDLRCEVRHGAALAMLSDGRVAEARATLEAALAIAREGGDRSAEAWAQALMVLAARRDGDLDQALEHHRRAEALFRTAGDREAEAAAVGFLGSVYGWRARHEEAREQQEKALRLYEAAGNRAGAAATLGSLGVIFRALGRYEDSLSCYRRSLSIARESGSRDSEWTSLGNLAEILADLGEYREAAEHVERALEIARELGSRWKVALSLRTACELGLAEGDGPRAERLLAEAERLAEKDPHPQTTWRTLMLRGRIAVEAGRREEAAALYRQARAAARGLGPGPEILPAAYLAALGEGDAEELRLALDRHGDSLHPPERLEVLMALFRITEDPQHLRAAHRLLAGLRERAPEALRESMIRNVPLHREIMAAWEELTL